MKTKIEIKKILPVISACLITLLVIVLTAVFKINLGIAGEWQWPHIPFNHEAPLWFPCFVFFIFLCFLWACLLLKNKFFILGGLIIFSLLFQISIGMVGPYGLEEYIVVTLSSPLSGYFHESLKISSLSDFLGNYSVLRADFNFHARGYPPGSIIYGWLVNKLVKSFPGAANKALDMAQGTFMDPGAAFSAWEGAYNNNIPLPLKAGIFISSWLILLISSLTILPLYFLAGKISNDKETALFTASLYLLIPGIFMFVPGIDVVFPVFTVTALYLSWVGLVDRSDYYIWGAGIVLGIGLFFSLALAVVGALICLVFIFFFLKKVLSCVVSYENIIGFLRSSSLCILKLIGGMLIMVFIYKLVFRINLFHVLNECRSENSLFNLTHKRSYFKWVGYNFVDFFLFTGTAVSTFFIIRIYSGIRNLVKNKELFLMDSIGWAFGLTLLLLDFSGQNLGETARLWIFLMPVLVLISTDRLKETGPWQTLIFFVLLLLQFLQTVIFKMSFNTHTI